MKKENNKHIGYNELKDMLDDKTGYLCLNEGHDVCSCGNCEEIPQDLLTAIEKTNE